jgi:tripartite-type tricarboxylate transporter receptor subunit TctC
MVRYRFYSGMAVAFCVLAVFVLSSPAPAAEYPQKGKAIQLMVHWAAGGSSDAGARILASGLEKELGTSILVVNKPGAGGQIGYTALSQARPDGYTIGSTNFPSAVSSYLDTDRKAVYNRKSFQLLALHVVDPGLFAVKADSPFKSLKDVFDAAKAAPKKIRVTTTGIQADEHFATLQLEKMTGVQFARVHLTGAAPSITAVLGGKIEIYCGNEGDLMAQVQSGAMRILGIMDKGASPFYPGVKTFEEQGYKIYFGSSRGFAAPSGTPKEIVDILSRAIKNVAATDDHKKKMAQMGLTLRYMDPEQYLKYWDEYEAMLKELMPLVKQES